MQEAEKAAPFDLQKTRLALIEAYRENGVTLTREDIDGWMIQAGATAVGKLARIAELVEEAEAAASNGDLDETLSALAQIRELAT